MKKTKLFFILGVLIIFVGVGCAPTIVTKSVSETTHPDGQKTTTVTRSLSQHIQEMETKSTKEVKDYFDR
ncbi:MAG: hypothetical protein NTX30_21690 [Deltaproteobacteria bacterium]|jgi:hypothetical protein|nr:hypothetical protein [Deltaproteobacteria bacterium]